MASEPAGHPPMGADLLRQRRNLLVISLALICVNLAGAEFGNKIGLMGTEITFARKWVLIAGAWVFWAYFLIRYIQYLLEVPNLGIRAAVYARMAKYLREDAGLSSTGASFKVVPKALLRWKIVDTGYDPVSDSAIERGDPIRFVSGLGWFLKAGAAVALKTPRVTDYALPVLVAVAAPITGIISAFCM